MRIGVISDTHLRSVTQGLREVFERYFRDVDMIVHAGDVVSMSVLDYLSQKPLKAVCGNMDSMEIQDSFPEKLTFKAGDRLIGLIHGWGAPWDLPKRIKKEFEGVEAIIFGHSHLPYCAFEDRILLFNPGSPAFGQGRKGEGGTIGIIEIQKEMVGKIVYL